MNHIVIDLEFDSMAKVFKRGGKPTYQEIIEIGAVKLDSEYNVIDTFQTFVHPVFLFRLSDTVKNLTGITDCDLAGAPMIASALHSLYLWAGREGAYDIYAWSQNDEDQIIAETALKGVNNPFFETDFIDLQAMFDESVGLYKRLSLQTALEWLNISAEGRAHRACSDAYNTAQILRVLNDESESAIRFEPIRRIFVPSESYTYTLGDALGVDLTELFSSCAS